MLPIIAQVLGLFCHEHHIDNNIIQSHSHYCCPSCSRVSLKFSCKPRCFRKHSGWLDVQPKRWPVRQAPNQNSLNGILTPETAPPSISSWPVTVHLSLFSAALFHPHHKCWPSTSRIIQTGKITYFTWVPLMQFYFSEYWLRAVDVDDNEVLSNSDPFSLFAVGSGLTLSPLPTTWA